MSKESQKQIADECDAIKAILLEKNRAYGNSALEPVRIFSRAATDEQIRVRLDDKLSRLVRGEAAGEDVELDIIGYLVLLRVSRRIRAAYAPAGIPAELLNPPAWQVPQRYASLDPDGAPIYEAEAMDAVARVDVGACGLPSRDGVRCSLPPNHEGYHWSSQVGSFSPSAPPEPSSAGPGLPWDVG